jgi:uncharacterized protein (TIGR03437 family)
LNAAGQVPDTLGGAQVLFDGTAAPMLYSSANRTTVVVPFEIGGPRTQIVVKNEAGLSTPISVPVAAAAPAVLTVSELGNGQIAALNEDGSVNSAVNPAPINSVVSVFATGLGQITPAGGDGTVASDVLPSPNLPLSVQIGGLPAFVLYAGAAPGTVEGVFQINFRIPPLVPTGSYLMVVLQAGDAFSQTDVWISVSD